MATFEYVKIGDGVTPFDSLPYVAGMPGMTGPRGPQGDQGAAGVSGGLILQLDYSESLDNHIVGDSINIIQRRNAS